MFTIKKYCFIFMLCFLIASFSFHYLWAKESTTSSNPQKIEGEQAPAQNQPQITIDLTQVDVGEVYEGDEAVHTFTVKNTGTAQLNIAKVKAG